MTQQQPNQQDKMEEEGTPLDEPAGDPADRADYFTWKPGI